MNLEQLNAMTDLEIDEAVALAQGLGVHRVTCDVWLMENGKPTGIYSPTANTTEGKAQAFDLMVKYKLDVSHMRSGNWAVHCHGQALVYGEKPNQLIVIASILSAQKK